MYNLTILQYSGLALLVVLLIIFEVKNFKCGEFGDNYSYIYYTCNNIAVRVRRTVPSCYKIYVIDMDSCPVQTKRDRYGTYFKIRAKSAQNAEYKIDELFRTR